MEFILVTFCLATVSFRYTDGVLGELKKSLTLEHQYKYWEKDMAKMEFSTNVELRLVRHDWKPRGPLMPQGQRMQPRYSGSVLEADAVLKDKENNYVFEGRPLDTAHELLNFRRGYDKKLESIFIFHTISSDSSDDFAKTVVTALAMRNYMRMYNVFVFYLPELQSSMSQTIVTTAYGQKASYENLGNVIGEFFTSAIKQIFIEAHQIHLLGFCYSSQLAGYVARIINTLNKRKKVKSITALDPFTMGLSGVRNKILSRFDADYVFAYHTNSLFYGTIYRRATADFNFNSGLIQPGCYTTFDPNCSHRRVIDLFAYIILYPEKWLARKCQTWLFFKSCLCNIAPKVVLPFPPIMGIRGMYFLNTNANKPYGYGFEGTRCYTSYDKTQFFPDGDENENQDQKKNENENQSQSQSPSTSQNQKQNKKQNVDDDNGDDFDSENLPE